MWSSDVPIADSLSRLLNKQLNCWWFEIRSTPSVNTQTRVYRPATYHILDEEPCRSVRLHLEANVTLHTRPSLIAITIDDLENGMNFDAIMV